MREAGVGAIHRLRLEAEIIAGGFGIKRALDGQQELIEQWLVGSVGEEMTKIQSVGGTVWIKRDAGVAEPDTVIVSHQLAGGGGGVAATSAARAIPLARPRKVPAQSAGTRMDFNGRCISYLPTRPMVDTQRAAKLFLQ
jgi:hypothetical protein